MKNRLKLVTKKEVVLKEVFCSPPPCAPPPQPHLGSESRLKKRGAAVPVPQSSAAWQWNLLCACPQNRSLCQR